MNRKKFLENAALAVPGVLTANSLLGNSFSSTNTKKKLSHTYFGKNKIRLTISETETEIAKGLIFKTIAYNNSVPGPVIRMKEGEETIVEVINNTDHQEVVHWHGQEIPAEVDGALEEGTPPIEPHSKRTYKFKPGPAGVKWYHTHAMTQGDKQKAMYSGQIGIVYIEPKDGKRQYKTAYDRELFFITHDWKYFLQGALFKDFDRLVYTVNGKSLGFDSPIKVKEGEKILLHFVNGNARDDIRFSCSGHKMKILGLDGRPVPKPDYVNDIKLGSGERADILVEMNNPGKWIFGDPDEERRKGGLGFVVEYPDQKGDPKWEVDSFGNRWDYSLFSIEPKKTKPKNEITVEIKRYETENGTLYKVNGKPFEEQEDPIPLKYGEDYRIHFYNSNIKSHPLHLHRHYFELVNVEGKEMSGIMKDTVFVNKNSYAAVDLKATQKGLALFHCHKQNHMEEGFMALFETI